MTSSKKAKKPSSSFKKAYGQDYTAGQGFSSDDRDRLKKMAETGVHGKKAAGTIAAKKYEKLKGKQTVGAQEQGTDSTDETVRQPVKTGSGQVIHGRTQPETISGATAQQRGVQATGGQTREQVAEQTIAPKASEQINDPAAAQQIRTNLEENERSHEAAAQQEEAEKKKRHDDYVNDYMTKKKQENTIKGGAPLDEDQLRQEAESEFQKWDLQKEKEASDKAERDRLVDEKFHELANEKSAKGEQFDVNDLRREAEEYADAEIAERNRDPEAEKAEAEKKAAEEAAAAEKRQATLQQNLDWLGDTFKAMGKAGEYINQGLDILGGVLHAALNPSPLGLNEAQSILTTTADAFNLANDLVGSLTKAGEEHIGKKIVQNMAAEMGKIINANFGGRDLNDLTPKELNAFTDQLTQAWQPFMDRLERIGANNPAGRALANKFIETFGQINKQAKSNRENIRLDKKKMEADIRERKRKNEELKFKTTQGVVNYTKQYHTDLMNPNSAIYDEDAALALDILNEQLGHDASNLPYELTHDSHGNSIIDDNYYAVLLDKKLHRYNPNTGKFEMTQQGALTVAKRIMDMKKNKDPAYLSDPDRYDAVLNMAMERYVRAREGMNDALAEEKYKQHMEGERTPIERVKGAKTLSDRNYIRKLMDEGQDLAEIFPKELRKRIATAAGSDVRKYENILATRGYLTQEERNAYNIAKNTQDLVLFIDDAENLKKMIGTYRDKRGDEDWINPATGETMINPQTNRNYKISELFDYDFINKQLNDIDREMNEAILSMPLSYKDTNANGDVARVHIMQVSNGQSDSVRQRLLDIQSLFPGVNIIKDPAGPYRERIGMGDITRALYEGMRNDDINMAQFASIMIDKLDTLDRDIKDFDINSNFRSVQLSGMLGVISGRVSSLSRALQINPGALSGPDRQAIIEAIDRVNTTMSTGLSELSKKVGEMDKNLADKLDLLKKAGDEALDALKKGDPNAAQLVQKFVQMNDAITVKLDEDTISRLEGMGGGGGNPVPPPAGEKRQIPSWYDASASGTAGNQWYTHMLKDYGISDPKDPSKWPPGQYWNIQNDLLSLIENTSDRGDKAALRDIAQRAFRHGMFGKITKTKDANGKDVYQVEVPQNGGMTPLVNLVVGSDGKVYPRGNNTQPYSYIGPDGKPVELTADNYNQFLKQLFDMDNNETAARIDSQNNLDLSKDATSAAGGEKYMKALVKLFAPLI